jgi:hypothetical protein
LIDHHPNEAPRQIRDHWITKKFTRCLFASLGSEKILIIEPVRGNVKASDDVFRMPR